MTNPTPQQIHVIDNKFGERKMNNKFISSTIGFNAKNLHNDKIVLARAEFYRLADNNVCIKLVSGRSLRYLGTSRTITSDEFSDRPYDVYNGFVEFEWAMNQCGWESASHQLTEHDA